MGGHPEDGRGEDDRVLTPQQAGGDAGAHVGQGVGHDAGVPLAHERRPALLGAGELHQDEEVTVLGQPVQGGADPLLDAAGRVGLAGDGFTLGLAHGGQRVGEDFGEQLVLGGEVPVEDPFADAHAHRRCW